MMYTIGGNCIPLAPSLRICINVRSQQQEKAGFAKDHPSTPFPSIHWT